MWGALSDERTSLSFTISAGPRQRSHSRVRVPCYSRPYFTVPDSRLPFSPPPTTCSVTVEVFYLSLSLMLRPTVSLLVCLGIMHPSGAYDQIFITVKTVAGLLPWGALPDERTGLRFTIAAGPRQRSHFRSESRGTRDHILLSQIRDFPFRRLLGLAGLW
jgi:hypothetical protein